MSLESWKQAYYPVDADAVDSQDAVAHSLRKWEGLRPENLAEHEMEIFDVGIRDEMDNYLPITAGTCALCHHYWDDCDGKTEDVDVEPEDHSCGECPLYLVRGNRSCCEERDGEQYSPYRQWTAWGNPEPMIGWLKQAQEYEAAQAKPAIKVRVHEGPMPTHPEVINLTPQPRTSHAPLGGLTHESPAKPSLSDPEGD